MVARASYKRSRERAQDFKGWVEDVNPSMDWNEYGAKFNALTYYWPIVGDIRRASEEISDLNRYVEYHGMSWKDLKPGRIAALTPHVGSATYMLSKNLMRLYR